MNCPLCRTSRDAILCDHFGCFKDIVLSYGHSPNPNKQIQRDLGLSIVSGKIKYVEFLFELGADPSEQCIIHRSLGSRDEIPLNAQELIKMMKETATTDQIKEQYREMEEFIEFYAIQKIIKEPSE